LFFKGSNSTRFSPRPHRQRDAKRLSISSSGIKTSLFRIAATPGGRTGSTSPVVRGFLVNKIAFFQKRKGLPEFPIPLIL
jgi:hypothetical protein